MCVLFLLDSTGSADQSACRGANCYITLTGRGEIEADRGGRGRKGTSSEETHLDSLPRFPVCPRDKTVRHPAWIECEARCSQRTDWHGGIPDGEGVMAAFGCRGVESFGGQWGGRGRRRGRATARKERVIDNHRTQERTRGMISRLPLTRE